MNKYFYVFARFSYAVIRGRWPRFVAELKLRRMAKSPTTFGQHILHKMAFDRNPLRAFVTDKLLAKDYIKEKIGVRYLPEVYFVTDNADNLTNYSLPSEFVLKVNHGSGGVIVVWSGANKMNKLPKNTRLLGWRRFQIHPDNFDLENAKNILNYWLTKDYSYWPGRLPEWNYTNIARKCFVEELLIGTSGFLPSDYRFYTFRGITKIIGVDTIHPDGTKSVKHFYPDWLPIDVRLKAGRKWLPETTNIPDKPNQLAEMIRLAKVLGEDFDWIRIDFFISSGRVYVGELTNFPTAGQGVYDPKFLDEYLGKFFNE